VDNASLLRDFAIIMAAGGVALVVFKLLRQPPVLGYLIAGALIGPNLLPAISSEDIPTIRRIADLGLIVLLFTLGIDFGWQRIRRAGMPVVLIGFIEVAVMFAIGYEAGRLLGWSSMESVFLGAALTNSSSAVIARYLRDTGQLHSRRGTLIMGVSLVEDFLGVVLLSILAGVANSEQSNDLNVPQLGLKLGIFTISALVFGTLIVPRLLKFVERFKSAETGLLAALALCFGLGLVAQELQLSAAAGAFLIGTVIGDTHHSESVSRVTAPVRDMFAAVFFVSVGMLVDFRDLSSSIVPVFVVAGVFIFGKFAANFIGAVLTGQGGKTAVEVGAGMPQLGEFSIAIVKVGTDHGILGAAIYPVVTLANVITSFCFPFIFRSPALIVRIASAAAPGFLRRGWRDGTVRYGWLRRMTGLRGERSRSTGHALRLVLTNIVIVAMLLAVATVVLRYLVRVSGVEEGASGLPGLIVGAVAVTLCVPSGLVIWRAASDLVERLTAEVMERKLGPIGLPRRLAVARAVEESLLAVLIGTAAFFSLPRVVDLLGIGPLTSPASIAVMLATVLITARVALRVHRALESTLGRTLMGE
jgi:CPA2 family monovalent cation:H+ antiporter-2